MAGDVFFDNIQIETTVPGSPPVISVEVAPDRHVAINIVGTVGAVYRIEYTDDLTGTWRTLGNMVLLNSPSAFADPEQISNVRKRFYRVADVP